MGFSTHENLLPVFLTLSCFYTNFGTALDTITASRFIKDPETVSSNDNAFKLGFFSPENTTNRYVGIWYLSESNVIWVANRGQPLQDSSGIVTISDNRNIVVLNAKKQVVWSSNVSTVGSNSTAQLLNSGNLVLLDDTTGMIIWESLKHPSNTFLPNLILSTNQITGEKVKVTSWKSPSDPATGNFSGSLERLSVPEVFIWNQTQPFWRSGPWNGQVFIGLAKMYTSAYLNGFNIEREENGTVQITYSLPNNSFFGTIVLSSDGKLIYTAWINRQLVGKRVIQESNCDVYGFCGTYGSCDSRNSPICSCLRGFEPKNVDEWNRQNWTSGCVRRTELQCKRVRKGSEAGKEDGFLKLEMSKVPDFADQTTVSDETCRTDCLNNCSCKAYAHDPGIGCMSWSEKLIDIQRFQSGGVDLHIRLAYSELDGERERNKKVIILVTVIVGTLIVSTCAYFLWAWTSKRSARRMLRNTRETHPENRTGGLSEELKRVKNFQDLPVFDFRYISTATDNFNSSNKLGQGGFGSVYKGELQDGQEVAVKRLSRASGQGLEEFMNEVIVISKLQHRNLVRLLGCCIEGEEKMLIYEYMPNKSLDFYLFDPVKKVVLDWQKRFNIIEGISRGLLYLHRDSRLRIIHRDLKPSNILLDRELNPKISDFGMAKIFGGSEDEANTRRVVGTYGYMSPEYAMEGLFSEKSDVFSFGVLLLEIISGRKNTSFYNHERSLSLLGYAWKLWNEDEIISLIDPNISNPDHGNDILRCIHIGLLCVQELARERPTMATVVSMLKSEIVNFPPPQQPAFIQKQLVLSGESSQPSHRSSSINDVTVTNLQGR
ncbi:G-type lectin S-receptor-like serine/threonine-protein kinase At1g11300 [Gastrolobium bilobum]|uniref:G-type lectin S-receptor-like serine/threonine-protein kinase At1g11300 n=1 Tax=Gastrolobium bilobum TaxID=150636 RepID=UPI002AB273F6|nr:G-type lectin S-receptor-like serine/threonine-protein kinase At1g11300 [Gastrolobium bilobum]